MRMLLHDCSSGTAKFSDEELEWFVDNSASVWYAAAEAADALAMQITASGVRKKVGDLEIDYGGTALQYRGLAARFRARGALAAVPYAGGITRSGKDAEKADSDRPAPAVSIGMHDYAGSTY